MGRSTVRRGGGGFLRRAYGVLAVLCVALAVLVHHDTYAPAMPRMEHSGMTSMLAPSGTASGHGAHRTSAAADGSVAGVASEGCGMSGGQHCSAAAVGSVQLTLPGHSPLTSPSALGRTVSRSSPTGVAGRAPPDLSDLSQLRI
ncbi:DUF6153 family protein [Streptomyces sp. NPDC048566]|uniref:DUF6153 family protein n=1 Tax=Streptomyces sp. NPDC048566 TaxID=3365569 RepID=UPI003715AA80